MNNIRIKQVVSDYQKLKNCAGAAFKHGRLGHSLDFIKTAASIGYHLNFRYNDDDLEMLLGHISKKLVGESYIEKKQKNYIFYDQFGLDNKGLTQQYITALIASDCEFLYILNNDSSRSVDILKQLKEAKNARIFIIDNSLSDIERIRVIFHLVEGYRPEKAFLHMGPMDVVGVCLWNAFGNLTRYLINLTDHAYWLGKSCSDYFIEFRDYGYTISIEQRKIRPETILFLPYYPIVKNHKFDGIPAITHGKKIILSGGAFYKIYGENDTFFKILKRIINDNNEAIVLFAGAGNSTSFVKFIKENKLEDKILLLGSRKDINEIYKHADLYICTFPISGGLMAQYAVHNQKIPIGFTSNDLPCNYIESLFNLEENVKLTYTDLDEFHYEVNKLLNDNDYKKTRVKLIEKAIIDEDTFNNRFSELISNNKLNKTMTKVSIDNERFSALYFEAENNYLHSYYFIKLRFIKFFYYKYDFPSFIHDSFCLCLEYLRRLFNKK